MKRLLFVLSAILLALTGSFAAAAQDYEIRLTHPVKAGSTFQLLATSSETIKKKVTFDNQVLHNSEVGFILELSAQVTILELNAKNWVTRKSVKIIESTITRDGNSAPLLPKGSIIIASIENGATVFHVNGRRVDMEITKALKSVVSLQTSDRTDDKLFGTSVRRKVGETWDVNSQAAISTLNELGIAGKREDIKGTSTLEKVVNDYLFVRSWLSINNVFLFPLPEGGKAESGEIRSEFSARFPIKQNDTSFDQSLRVIISTNGKMQPDGSDSQTKIEMVLDTSARVEIRAVDRVTQLPRRRSRR